MFKCSASFWTSPVPPPPAKQPNVATFSAAKTCGAGGTHHPEGSARAFSELHLWEGRARTGGSASPKPLRGPVALPQRSFRSPPPTSPPPPPACEQSTGKASRASWWVLSRNRPGPLPLGPGSARGPDTETVLRAAQHSPSRVQHNAQAESSPEFFERRARGRLSSCTREGGPSTCKGGPPPSPSSSRSGIQRG